MNYEENNEDRGIQLIPLRFIIGNIDQVLKNWFDLSELYKPVYDLYLSSIRNPGMVIENEFSNLAQALEAFHRRKFPGIYLDKQEFQDNTLPLLKKSIPDCLRDDLRMRICESMEYINEFSLRKRIKKLIDNLPIELGFKSKQMLNTKEKLSRILC